ncbi:MAG: hypothetical protein WBO34_03260 [Gammaproteobacteria bacterium]
MKKIIIGLMVLTLSISGTAAKAGWPGDVYPGDTFHAEPSDFLFGNHIDTHIQLDLKTTVGGYPKRLRGSFYIIFTDDQGESLGIDVASGLPIARHPRGTNEDHDETCGVSEKIICVVGWRMRGLPGAAKFISHDGINGDDHPIWMVNRAEEKSAPAPGMVIPQPGSYTHMHWITRTSTDPRASDVLDECNKQKAGQLEDQEPTAVNEVCQGWFLQIRAVRNFAFKHGGETIPVRRGIDNRSHLNTVTNYRSPTAEPISKTRD